MYMNSKNMSYVSTFYILEYIYLIYLPKVPRFRKEASYIGHSNRKERF